MKEIGIVTVFTKSGHRFEELPSYEMYCPIGMSELILRLFAEDKRVMSIRDCPGEIQEFFILQLWFNKIVKSDSFENVVAVRFSYMGYSYWVAMSTRFFEYAVKTSMIDVPADFKVPTVSGYFLREK